MGREIIFEVVKDGDKVVFPKDGADVLYVCGRDDATSYLAGYIGYEEPCYKDIDRESDDFQTIQDALHEYYLADYKEIEKAQDTLADLREARRHATKYKDFVEFSEVMERTQDWIKDNDYSRAGSMINCLNKCYDFIDEHQYKYLDLPEYKDKKVWDFAEEDKKYKIRITLSE